MRPRFHYAPHANWLSDPNGLVHDRGEWHMAYQYNPHGEEWGHMAWGHAISRDLVHWTELPPALVETDGEMVFSGSAVIDHEGTAAFGKGAMVAVYTGAQIAAQRQVQCLAYSTDAGRHWTRHVGNPVLDLGLADFRDPNVIWHDATARWIMTVVLSTQNRAAIYASPNLRDWTLLSHIETDSAPGHLWECPLLIELPVEGHREPRWLFKVDVLSGAPGSGALYRTGHFDGERFHADGPWQVADHGQDFYAAIAWHAPHDGEGRPVWIGWLGNHAVQKALPLQGWRGAMSVPRRLALAMAGGTFRLRQTVEPALMDQFGAPQPLALGHAPVALAPGIVAGLAGDFALTLEDGTGRRIDLMRTAAGLRLARRDPVTPELDAEALAPLETASPILLLIDHGAIEVLADDGLVALTMQHRLAGETWRAGADRPVEATCRQWRGAPITAG